MKKYDVTIIGGGIAGICIAEMFSRDNLKVLAILHVYKHFFMLICNFGKQSNIEKYAE